MSCCSARAPPTQDARTSEGDTNRDESALWWGLLFALTPHWELGISREAQYEKSDVEELRVRFTRWGGELRYRPQSQDPVRR